MPNAHTKYMTARSARSTGWNATFQSSPAAAATPSGGTTTATSVTTWLMRLVRGRTVPRAARGSGAGASTTANQYSQPDEGWLVRIAIIGGGISGLGAAYLLSR